MGQREVLEVLGSEDRWFSSTEIKSALGRGDATVCKSLLVLTAHGEVEREVRVGHTNRNTTKLYYYRLRRDADV